MRKCIHIYADPRYPLSLLELTVPSIERYAKKIGAALNYITARKFPDYPASYEKIQIHEAGLGYDWNACINASFLLGPELADFSAFANPKEVAICWSFNADSIFRVFDDPCFMRDKRNRALVDEMLATSSFTHDLWQPLKGPCAEYQHIIHSRNPDRIVTYCLARNLARYALRYSAMFPNDREFLRLDPFTQDESEMVTQSETTLRSWGVREFRPGLYVFMQAFVEFLAEGAAPAPPNPLDRTANTSGAPFPALVKKLISQHKVEEIIETGTYDGLGSSTVFAMTGRPLVTVECNPKSCSAARFNLRRFPNAHVMNALSLPLEDMLGFIRADSGHRRRNKNRGSENLYVEEISQPAPRENVLFALINNDKRQLIFLDSSSATGYLEFSEVMKLEPSRLKKKVLLLNDADSLKHRRSVSRLKSRGFQVVSRGRLACCAFAKKRKTAGKK